MQFSRYWMKVSQAYNQSKGWLRPYQILDSGFLVSWILNSQVQDLEFWKQKFLHLQSRLFYTGQIWFFVAVMYLFIYILILFIYSSVRSFANLFLFSGISKCNRSAWQTSYSLSSSSWLYLLNRIPGYIPWCRRKRVHWEVPNDSPTPGS